MYPESNRYPAGNPYQPARQNQSAADTRLTDQFSRDLTALARLGRLDPVVGRDRELERVIQILSRRTKNNPALIGEPGVGKTAVAEALAQAMANGSVPPGLKGKRLLCLDLASMVAGTKYRGEFEERVRNMLAELRRAGDVILFLDELHTVVGAGSAEGAIDAANLLKPALGRGELQVVGATTVSEYRRYIEKDAALERRFQPVTVSEPTREETLNILKTLRPRYEQHHGLAIPDAALEAAVELAGRYLPQRRFPDKAVDLMDEAAALTRTTHRGGTPFPWQRGWKGEVTPQTVAKVAALWTGIPVEELTLGERERLSGLEKELSRVVIGQPRAVRAVAQAVRRGRLGLQDPRRPAGSFLFLGPTGVGKTQLCRELAKALFGSEEQLLRFDMSEYTDKHTAARLVGAPPGYVGYDNGGELIERIRRQPYSLVLFDEVEKAHPGVLDLLLQILEEGTLTDGQGRKADFRNAVIVLTSNLGAHKLGERAVALGFGDGDADGGKRRREAALSAAKEFFRPEFLGRLDEIVLFDPLDLSALTAIARSLLDQSGARLARYGVRLELPPGQVEELARRAAREGAGARPLRRLIAREVEDRAACGLLEGELRAGSCLCLQVEQEEKVIV